jgi:hypothetical protein
MDLDKNSVDNIISYIPINEYSTLMMVNYLFYEQVTNREEYAKYVLLCKYIKHDKASLNFCHAYNQLPRVNKLFLAACFKGFLNTAKCIYPLIDSRSFSSRLILFIRICEEGHFETAKWYLGLNVINIQHIYPLSLANICLKGHYEIFDWLVLMLKDDSISNVVFDHCCSEGNLDAVKYLWSKYSKYIKLVDTSFYYKYKPLYNCCKGGHVNVAGWILSIMGESLKSIDNQLIWNIFVYCCQDTAHRNIIALFLKSKFIDKLRFRENLSDLILNSTVMETRIFLKLLQKNF